jgi:hypothetical protein
MVMVHDVQPKLTGIHPNHGYSIKCQAPVGPDSIVICESIVSTCVLVNKCLENLLRPLTLH